MAVEIRLVAPSVWRTQIESVWGDIPQRERDLAQTILQTVQDQHVGITPFLAGTLAQVLLKRGSPSDRVWKTVYKRLEQALEKLAGEQRSGSGGGIVLSNVPYHYIVLRLVLPLVALACQRIDRIYLFCEDEGSVALDSYHAYASELNDAVCAIADHQVDLYPAFWAECAITLRTMSKTANWQSAETAPLPVTDPQSLTLFLTLDPTAEQEKKQNQRSLKLTNRRREVNPRFVDAGVDGIRQASSADEIHRVLLSEFMLPRTIRNDRFANNEFFVIKRPPKPVRLRDVLIVGILPGDIKDEASRTLLKACWFDTLVWLSQRLRQSGLGQSEFRWIEGDSYGRWRSKSFLLEEMPTIVLQQELEQTKAYRQQFMLALRWLPALLDEQAIYGDSLSAGSVGTHNTKWEVFKSWLRQSWHAQRENQHWQSTRRQSRRGDVARFIDSTLSDKPLDIAQFAFVHALTFVPQTLQTETRRTQLGETNAVLRFGSQPSRSLSLTWVPTDLQETEGWRLDGKAWRERRLVKTTSAESLHKIAADVITGWQTILLKEMQRG